MNIVIFTADVHNGAMYQIACTMTEKSVALGFSTTAFFPDADTLTVSDIKGAEIVRYRKKKTFNIFDNAIKVVREKILSYKPDYVISIDDAIFSMEVFYHIHSRVKTAFMIHDVNPHPTSSGLKKRLTIALSQQYRKLGIKYAHRILLLSKNSMDKFTERYGQNDRTFLFPLGAHPPICNNVCSPVEYSGESDYVLFFGRIDKYKGIERLLKAYRNISIHNLIIAGKGPLTEDECALVKANDKITLINRFIKDEEVLWLFKNCKTVVLPYIEASQSGVLPIAYYFGKPVICSAIPGLLDFVEEGKTGYTFNDEQELAEKIQEIFNHNNNDFSDNCISYSRNYLSWENNIIKLVNS